MAAVDLDRLDAEAFTCDLAHPVRPERAVVPGTTNVEGARGGRAGGAWAYTAAG
jgi:hypothetical protein